MCAHSVRTAVWTGELLAGVIGPAADVLLLANLAVGETSILLNPPLPLAGVSTWMERGCQQNAHPYPHPLPMFSCYGCYNREREEGVYKMTVSPTARPTMG